MAGRDLSAELFGPDVVAGGRDLSGELGFTSQGAPMTRAEKIAKGLRDPIDGGAQLLTNLLPKGIVDAGNSVNNWLADKTGLVGRLPEGGINEQVKTNEANYQNKRTAAGESGFDGYRVLGNIVNPANLALAAKLPQAASLAGRVGVGALGGASSALLDPVTSGDHYWGDKGTQVAVGAAGGGVVPAIAGGFGRVISPKASIDPKLALLKQEGVNPTIGQTLGGWANRLEEKAQSLPIVGDAITAARQQSGNQLNRASMNRALEPIGEKLPLTVPLGNDAIEYTRRTLGDKYDALLPKMTVQADHPFVSSLQNLQSMVQQGALDPKYSNKFAQILQDRVLGKFQGQNAMTGQTLKDTQSFLTNEIKRFGQSQDPDARLLGDALKEVGANLKDLSIRSNPGMSNELKAIDTAWANFKRVQKAASSVAAEDGVFSPAQLHNAVKAADRSKDKARFAEGNALMQDLSGAGKSMLSNKVPDSGTAGRLMLGAGGLATGAVSPMIPAGLIGGAAMYTPAMQRLLSGSVSTRPQSAQAIAEIFRKAAPALVPSGAQIGLGLLD